MLKFVRATVSMLQQRTRTVPGSEVSTTPKLPTAVSPLLSLCLVVTALVLSSAVIAADVASTTSTDFQIPAENLADALSKFGSQTGMQVVYAPELARGLKARALSGRLTIDAALKRLLEGTGLAWSYVNGNTVVLKRVEPKKASANGPSDPSTAATPTEEVTVLGKMPEVMVFGSRSINADIQRTEDDIQPYVVFDREQIERSMSDTLDDFLKTRLPMNAVQGLQSQSASSVRGSQSSIDLRGLGTNQTLVLVDGRRMPVVNNGGALFGVAQSDINGIPLAAVERIEVLPSTASGIYGGGATGGVINIITRKDYAGVNVSANYGSTFRGDAANYRVDASAGFSLPDGETHVFIAASHAGSDPLLQGDRDFAARGRALLLANNPNSIFSAATPPAGYTSNVRSQNGSNLVLDSGTPLNSPHTFVPVGYAGPGSDGGAALVANAGQYNLEAPDTFSGNQQSLLNDPTVNSVSINLRREFGTRVEAFTDFSWLDNEGRSFSASGVPSTVTLAASASNNPFTTAINVTFPTTGLLFPTDSRAETLRAAGGLFVHMPRDWTVGADYVWGRTRSSYMLTSPVAGDPDGAGPGASVNAALTNGTLNVVRDLNAFPLDWSPYLLLSPNDVFGPADTVLHDATLRLSGPVMHLPAGPLTLSGLAEWREEKTSDSFRDLMDTTGAATYLYLPGTSQTVISYYLEALTPLVSEANAVPLMRTLEFQASARRDEYETNASNPNSATLASRESPLPAFTTSANEVEATEYTLGLRYEPITDLMLRASYGTGFLPPSVSNIVPNSPAMAMISAGIDPKRGGVPGTIGPFIQSAGGNPNLDPEDSESLSAGIVLRPRFMSGLRLSFDYTRIRKRGEITPLTAQQVIDLEDLLPGRLTRAPLTPEDAALGYTGGVITAVDVTRINLSATRLEAYDIQLDYDLQTSRFGRLRSYVAATWQPHLERQTLPTSQFVDSVGFNVGVLEWRGNVGLTWDKGPWTLGWNGQYFDSYSRCTPTATAASCATTTLNNGASKFGSQTYHDMIARYRFGESQRFMNDVLSDVEISIGIQNLLDEHPPVFASSGATGAYSTYGDPRLQRFTLTVRKTFGGDR